MLNLFSQITIPLTKSDLLKYNMEKDAMVFLNIDMAENWLYMVKGNQVSNNKLLVSSVLYNKSGLPERIYYYDEMQRPGSFVVIKYNNQNLPFEEIKFSSDSILMSGIMYEYNNENLLFRQIGYDNRTQIIYINSFFRENDSIFIVSTNNKNQIIYRSLISFYENEEKDLIKSMVKTDRNNKLIEETIFEYDKLTSLTKKTVYDSEDKGTLREFVYNEDGAMTKSVTYDYQNNEIQSISFEYDKYGNISRIIEYNEAEKMTSVYMMQYYTKTE
jgi:hypothetical protein